MTQIEINHHGDVTELLLASPESKNVLNDQLCDRVLEALDALEQQDSTKAIVLGSTGGIFSAGGDLDMLSDMGQAAQDETRHIELQAQLRSNMRVVERLWDFPKPIVAAVDGPCIGAGIGWMAACDIQIASETAFFDTVYLNLGVGTDFGVAWLLAQALGSARARDWILRPRRIPATEALTHGLVGQVVPSTHLRDSVYEAATSLTNVPMGVLHGVRRGVQEAQLLPLSQALDAESARFISQLKDARLPSRTS